MALARAHGVKVILVEVPMPPRHRQTFYTLPAWHQMRPYLQSLARDREAVYVTASDWVPDDACFEDAVHLNEQGTRLFSTRLASVLSRSSEISIHQLRRNISRQVFGDEGEGLALDAREVGPGADRGAAGKIAVE